MSGRNLIYWSVGGAAVAVASLGAYLYSTAFEIIRRRADMLYIQKCPSDSDGPVFHWKFDAVDGIRTEDASGKGNHGSLGSVFDTHRLLVPIPGKLRAFALPALVDGVEGKALEFDGRNWVHAGNSACYTTDRFTIAAWVWKKRETPPKGPAWLVPTIAAKSQWPGNGWWLCTRPNTNFIDMAISWGAARRHIHSGYELAPEEWHHVAVTMDNVDHEIRFFIDGEPYGETHAGVETWLTNWDQNLYVGDYDGTGRWPWFGRIDGVHYWIGEVPDAEIRALFERERASARAEASRPAGLLAAAAVCGGGFPCAE